MTNDVIPILGIAGGVFILIKGFFAFIAWYTSDEYDAVLRKALDRGWDFLWEHSPGELIHVSIIRLAKRTDTLFGTNWGLVYAFSLFFTLGIASGFTGWWAGISALLLESANFDHHGHNWFEMFWFVLDLRYGRSGLHPTDVEAVAFFSSALASGVSGVVTIQLLYHAAKTSSPRFLKVYLIVDLVVLVTVFLLMRITILMAAETTIGAAYSELDHHIAFLVSVYRDVNPRWQVAFVIITSAAALPTIIYLLVLLLSITLHYTPWPIRRFIMRVIYLVTTDGNKPVFSQLGTAFGAIGGLISVVVGILKYASL